MYNPPTRKPRPCITCGKTYTPANGNQLKYCSPKCRPSYGGSGLGLASATVGAISELEVSVDLMRKGWNVFRALSPACPCDLIIMKADVIKRIEVRTGYQTAAGHIGFPKAPRDEGKSDHYAISVRGKIQYIPPIQNIILD